MSEEQYAQATVGAWVGIVGNVALAVGKALVGWWSGSKALLADAAHSASDVVGSVAVLIGLRVAKRPPDEDHPYGHGKAETVSAIIVSVLLMLVGWEIGVSAVRAIWEGAATAPRWYALLAIVASIAIKEAMFRYKYRLGKRLGSQALIANAWEHRSDVYSSVAALIGVGGAVVGAYMGRPILAYLDPIAGVFVAALVMRMGYKMIAESIHMTLDHVLHEEETRELREAAELVPGVLAVHELRAREHGHYVIVDLRIGVDPHITVEEGHAIAKAVKTLMVARFPHVSDVFVHVNPHDRAGGPAAAVAGRSVPAADKTASEPDGRRPTFH